MEGYGVLGTLFGEEGLYIVCAGEGTRLPNALLQMGGLHNSRPNGCSRSLTYLLCLSPIYVLIIYGFGFIHC